MLFSSPAFRSLSKNFTSPTPPYSIFGDFVPVSPCGNVSPVSTRRNNLAGVPLGGAQGPPAVSDLALAYDDEGTLQTVVDLYVVGAICVIGFFGNAVTVLVLRRDPGRANNTTNWLLQCLALVDTMFLLTCVLIQPLRAINDYTDWLPGLRSVYPHIVPYIWPLAAIAQTMTVWTVLLVTADRYVAVCRPLCRNLRSLGRAKVLTAVGCALAVLYNLPLFFEHEVVVRDICQQRSVETVATGLRNNFTYFLVYKTLCYTLFRTAGPLAALVALNARLIATLRRRGRHRSRCRQAGRRGRQGHNVTLMLVAVVSVFIFCELPDLVLRVAASWEELRGVTSPAPAPRAVLVAGDPGTRWKRDLEERNSESSGGRAWIGSRGGVLGMEWGGGWEEDEGSHGIEEEQSGRGLNNDLLKYSNSLTNMLLAFNSSINFLIYCLVGTKFRRILLRQLPSCCPSSCPTCCPPCCDPCCVITPSRRSSLSPLSAADSTRPTVTRRHDDCDPVGLGADYDQAGGPRDGEASAGLGVRGARLSNGSRCMGWRMEVIPLTAFGARRHVPRQPCRTDDKHVDFALAGSGRTVGALRAGRIDTMGLSDSAHDVIYGVDVIVGHVVAATMGLMKGVEVASVFERSETNEITKESDLIPSACDDEVIEVADMLSECDDVMATDTK